MIQTVEKGFSRPRYESLPIEIHAERFVDWLVDRKICPRDWHAKWTALRERVAQLMDDLPAPFQPPSPQFHVPNSNSNNDNNNDKNKYKDEWTYADCQTVLERLTSVAEHAETNLLGQFTSPLSHRWAQVRKAYEAEKLYVIEGATLLHRLAGFTIPSLKKQIAYNQAQLKDLPQRDIECQTLANNCRRRYELTCAELGIAGRDVRHELSQLARELPAIFAALVALLQRPIVKEAVGLYDEFHRFLWAAAAASPSDATSAVVGTGLRLLRRLQANGNASAEELGADLEGDNASRGSSEPWTYVDSSSSVASSTASDDWEICVEHVGELGREDAQEAGHDAADAVSIGSSTGIWDSPDLRMQLANDLYEMKSFLSQRLAEMQHSDVLSVAIFQSAPVVLQTVTVDAMQKYLSAVDECIGSLESARTQQLLLLSKDVKYLDRLTNSVEQHRRQEEKFLARLESNAGKQARLLSANRELSERLASYTEVARRWKKQLENAVSKLYDNRPVYIVGEVNLL